MDAYAGRIAYADLTAGAIEVKETPQLLKSLYLGGRGFGARILTDLISPTVDPLSPENAFVFAAGPLTGTGVPLGSRYEVMTKSPLNGTLSSANSGGMFGWKMKKAGFDAIVITGKSEKPVFIHLNEGEASLKDAEPYWGMTTSETTDALIKDLDDSAAKVACIGPAGERLSRMACIINDKARAAGRGGLGAVLGSKNLKAVVATGSMEIGVADRDRLNGVMEEVREKINENGICDALKAYGTAVLVNIINENFILPTRNYQTAHFEGAEKVSGEKMAETILTKNHGCYACIVKCSRICTIDGVENEGPEYEIVWGFGPNLGIDDLESVAKASYLCNDLGIGGISTAGTIACAMEMAERGYIDSPLRFGDAPGMLEMVRKIGYREGIGDELADGSYRFAKAHGHPELSMTVKKQELPAYDPRGLQGHGLAYATGVRGGDHVYAYLIAPEVLGSPEKLDPYKSEGKAKWTKIFQDLTASIDASGICLFTSFALGADEYARLIRAATGMGIDEGRLMQIGERIWTLQKLFNMKAGYGKADDTLPVRLLTEPLQEGAPKGRVWEREPLLDEYYAARGWTEEGVPTKEKLEELGLLPH